ncbi:conserved hypothetical protein [Bacteroidetes oral taxon 274 str. F0058]|nr:conserved hypothetical protein [Bacteroidetes oral taxon 274 str. F0058]
MALYQSKTITVNKPFEEVYGKVSDLKNIEQFRDRIPKEYTVNFECDTDYVQFRVAPVGDLLLRIVERGADKIRLNIEKLPFKAEMSMNIGNVSPSETNIQLVLDADIPFFVKHIVGNKLEEGIDKIADILTLSLNSL